MSDRAANGHRVERLGIALRRATLDEILPLRQAVIIAGTNRSTPEFPGDREESTLHIAAFKEGRIVCCATFLMNDWEGAPAWQLRGMATEPKLQGKGIGRELLAYAETLIRSGDGPRLLWCNARRVAVDFYGRRGWTIETEEFEIEGVGPHRKMTKRLEIE